MSRRGFLFAALLAAVFLIAAGYFFLTGSFFLTRILTPAICRCTGLQIEIGHASLRLASRRVILHHFRLGDPEKPFLTVRRARGTANLLSLVQGIIDFDEVELTGFELYLCRDREMRWRWDDIIQGDEDSGGKNADEGGNGTVQLRFQKITAEESSIHVKLEDQRRKIDWCFSDFSGEAHNYRNNGVMQLRSACRFQIAGRPDQQFSGMLEWNGELPVTEDLAISGMTGLADFTRITGTVGGKKVPASNISGAIQTTWKDDGEWRFRKLRLMQQSQSGMENFLDLAGEYHASPYSFHMQVRRGLLSGTLLELLLDLSCGIRPGNVMMQFSGEINRNPTYWHSVISGHADRTAGPAWIGREKVDLPDLQLKIRHNFLLDQKQHFGRINHAGSSLTSGGKVLLSVQKQDDRTVKIKLDHLDLKWLRSLLPQQFFSGVEGSLGGDWQLQIAPRTEGFYGEGKLAARQIRLYGRPQSHAALWKSAAFDSELSGKITLPLGNTSCQLENLRTSILHQGVSVCDLVLSGSRSVADKQGDIVWHLKVDPLKLCGIAFPQMLSSREIAEKLPQTPLEIQGSGRIRISPQETVLEKHWLQLSGQDQLFGRLMLQDHRISDQTPSEEWKLAVRFSSPASYIGTWTGPIRITGGKIQLDGNLSGNAAGTDWIFRGESQWHNLRGTGFKTAFSDVSGSSQPGIRWSAGKISLDRTPLYCSVGGQPALRLETSGTADLRTGDFQNNLQLRYANFHLLDILVPQHLRSGSLSGDSQLHGNWKECSIAGNGSCHLDHLSTVEGGKEINGKFSCSINTLADRTRTLDGVVELAHAGKLKARSNLKIHVPPDEKKPVKIQLKTDPLELEWLYGQLGYTKHDPANTVRKPMDAGKRATEIHVNSRHVSWGTVHDFSAKGVIRMRRNQISVPEIEFSDGSGGLFSGSLEGFDLPDDTLMTLSGKVVRPLPVASFTTLFWPNSGMTGKITSGNFKLHFRHFAASNWGEDLNGSCRFAFEDVRVPVNSATGPISRMLLLPLETVVRAEKFFPSASNVQHRFKQLWAQKFSYDSPFSVLKFERGEIAANMQYGNLRIDRFRFSGAPITKLNLTGKADLVEPFTLQMESNTTLCGVDIKLPIKGTMQNPQIPTWQVLGKLPGANLQSWHSIFDNHSSESAWKPLIVSPFSRMLQSLSGHKASD